MNRGVFSGRVARMRKAVEEAPFGGVVIVPGPNMRYLTGVNSLLLERPFMLLVPVEGRAQLVAPKLEAGPYREAPLPMDIHEWTDSEGWDSSIRAAVKEANPRGTWGIEGRVPYLFLHRLMNHSALKPRDAEPLLQGLREVKDKEEMRLLRRSARILSRAFEAFPALISEGMTEMELARKVTEAVFASGAARVEDILVQSGPNASNPHWLPSSRKLRRGEGIVVDISSGFGGYCADITRTFAIGRARGLEEVYSKVLEAEERGLKAGREGAMVGDVDAAARNSLKAAGLARYFTHRTGHGLGLEVHEAPYIVESGRERLRNGMCFTVEPGAYIPKKLGVRMEDDALIEGGRTVEITTPPKEFGWWA